MNNDPLIILTAYIKNQWVVQMTCVKDNSEILISDIQPRDWEVSSKRNKHINKGYASVLMETLIRYAQECEAKRLYGNLSCNDLDHKDRLHHFYQKFGFVIKEYESAQNNYYGQIEKIL